MYVFFRGNMQTLPHVCSVQLRRSGNGARLLYKNDISAGMPCYIKHQTPQQPTIETNMNFERLSILMNLRMIAHKRIDEF